MLTCLRYSIVGPALQQKTTHVKLLPPSRRYIVILVTAVVACGLALFWRALFFGETFAERDLGSYYYAAKWLIAPLVRLSGDVPLWNPLFASGQPFAANPENELFHPLTSLFLVLPYEWAFRLQVILPPLFAVPCMFWFLRGLRRSRPAALLGAVAWGVGGFLLSSTNLLPSLFASASLPLTLGFAVRVVRFPSRTHLVGLCLSLALQCLTGEPVSLLATLLLLAGTVLSEGRAPSKKSWAFLLAGLSLGVLFAAVALLPGANHARQTIRAAGLTQAMANEWSMPPVRALELFSPHILGHVDRGNLARYWGTPFYGPKFFPYYYSLYPGLLVGLLALFAWSTRRWRLWIWGATALVGYSVALGDHFVVWPLLRHVPGLSGLRYPEKAAVVCFLSVVVAASHGFDWFMLGLRRRRAFLVALGIVAVTGAAIAVGLFLRRQALADRMVVVDGIRDACRMSVVALVLMLALWLSRGWRREVRGLLLCGLLGVDLVSAGKALVPTVPVASRAMLPQFLAPLVQPGRDDLIFHMAEWNPSFADSGGLAKPPAPARWGLSMTLERDFDFTQLRWTHESTDAWMEVVNSNPRLIEPLLARRGVTAIVKFAEGAHWDSNRLVGPGGGPAVQTLIARETNPFAFAATRVERVHGVQGWKDRIRELGEDVSTTVLVEDDQLEALNLPPSAAQIRLSRSGPMALGMEILTSGPGPAFVAINQTWHPGWRARLDGQPTRLIRTDLSLSGVLVPPGQHSVQLEYDDPWLRAGFLISLFAGFACLVLVAGPQLLAFAGRLRARKRVPASG
jgi:hypothetical protein